MASPDIVLICGKSSFSPEAHMLRLPEQANIKADSLWTFPVPVSIWNFQKNLPKHGKESGSPEMLPFTVLSCGIRKTKNISRNFLTNPGIFAM